MSFKYKVLIIISIFLLICVGIVMYSDSNPVITENDTIRINSQDLGTN